MLRVFLHLSLKTLERWLLLSYCRLLPGSEEQVTHRSDAGPKLCVCLWQTRSEQSAGGCSKGVDFDPLCFGPYHSVTKHSPLISQCNESTANGSISATCGSISSNLF